MADMPQARSSKQTFKFLKPLIKVEVGLKCQGLGLMQTSAIN